jgi:hypothetical protein
MQTDPSDLDLAHRLVVQELVEYLLLVHLPAHIILLVFVVVFERLVAPRASSCSCRISVEVLTLQRSRVSRRVPCRPVFLVAGVCARASSIVSGAVLVVDGMHLQSVASQQYHASLATISETFNISHAQAPSWAGWIGPPSHA